VSDITKYRNKHDNIITIRHYEIDAFNMAINQQLTELEDHFNSQATILLSLSTSLDPRSDTFDISKLYTLVKNVILLIFFQFHVYNHLELNTLSSFVDLMRSLSNMYKSFIYPTIDRLLRLISGHPSTLNCNH
jgi:hypothetical protein